MAPQNITPDMPLTQRLMVLAESLQFAWFCGHLVLLLCTFSYSLTYVTFKTASGWARFNYRTAFVGACTTYGIVVYKNYRSRARQGKSWPPLQFIADENVQYLLMALIWLFSFQIPLAITPFAVYSLFHVATYTRSNLLPALQPQPKDSKPSGLSEALGRFVRDYYDASMTTVAGLEIGLWFRILLSATLFTRGSWILLIVYTAFFRARHAQSSFMQSAIMQFTVRIDNFTASSNTPPAVRNFWNSFKGLVQQAADYTDLNKAARQANAPPKKEK